MKPKYRKPPFRICDQCRCNFRGWSVLCDACVKQVMAEDPERESLRDYRKRVIEGR